MSLEKLSRCPLCKSGLFLNHAEIKDFSISKEIFYLCECKQCNLLFTNPRPDEESIAKYYESVDYISHQNKSSSFVNLIYKAVRMFTTRNKVSILNLNTPNPGSVLDYGCGTGHFLKTAKSKGWKVTGIEPNPTARSYSEKQGVKTLATIEEIKKSKKFDAITLFHVIEHIHTLRQTVKDLLKHLDSNGRLYLAVPNHQSLDAKHYGQYWAAWDIPRHLYHFSQSSLQNLANEFNLEIESSLPMPFDSYYVAILSEKFKEPRNSMFSNFVNGLSFGRKSNTWAKLNNNEFSSLLFILKKK